MLMAEAAAAAACNKSYNSGSPQALHSQPQNCLLFMHHPCEPLEEGYLQLFSLLHTGTASTHT